MAPRAPSSRTRGKSPAVAGAGPATPSSRRKSSRRTPSLAQDSRPPLPLVHFNELLKANSIKRHQVKDQTLTLEHEKILIYRQKVPTPKGISGHIIRRTDTDAVSASSLFRCAFPTASTKQEDEEMEYIVTKYDTVTAGRENEEDNRGRLTGKWIPTADAQALAEEYGLYKFATELFAFPDVEQSPATDHSFVDGSKEEVEEAMQDTPPPSRQSKRQRLQSPVTKGRVAVEQSIQSDPVTGNSVETTKVTIETPETTVTDHASQEQKSLEAIASAKELVEQLKSAQVLPSLGESTSRKRSIEAVGASEPTIRRGWFGRKTRPIAGAVTTATTPRPAQARRLYAYASLAIVGAATAVAPYFL